MPSKARTPNPPACPRRATGWWLLALMLAGRPALAAEPAPKFLGAQSCASAMCHGGAAEKNNQHLIWTKKDFHTRAPATLSMARSARLAETLKHADASQEARCTVCHNPFQAVPAGQRDARIAPLEGVSCESCHNAAPAYLLTHTRPDLTSAQKASAGLRDLKNLYVRANTCVACHQTLDPEIRAAGHPELIFELDGQSATMPRHWSETNRWRGAQAWFVGQLVAAREAAAEAARPGATQETKARAAALRKLFVNEAGTPDAQAQAVAGEIWNRDHVRTWLRQLAGQHTGLTNTPEVPGEPAHRAERITQGLERLLVALGGPQKKSLSDRLDQLFRDVQSRPDFESGKFAEHLKDFETELDK